KKYSRKRSWDRLNCLPPFSKKNSTCWGISRFGNLLSTPSRPLWCFYTFKSLDEPFISLVTCHNQDSPVTAALGALNFNPECLRIKLMFLLPHLISFFFYTAVSELISIVSSLWSTGVTSFLGGFLRTSIDCR
ncbi:hypothetical protein L9F63_021197, partial [Diploptera punctata]